MLRLIEVVEKMHVGGIKQTPADGFDDFCVDKCRRFDTWFEPFYLFIELPGTN